MMGRIPSRRSTVERATESDEAVERTMHVDAPPEVVYRCWTDPDRLARWMGRDVAVDPRPGGEFRVDYNGKDVVSGTVLEVDPPRRLVVTWGWEAPGEAVRPGASRVELDFTPQADGTLVRLRHLDLPPAERQSHAEGWDHFLPNLPAAAREA
jgi:uncharacterized protein YndB with AHSA1/START domain